MLTHVRVPNIMRFFDWKFLRVDSLFPAAHNVKKSFFHFSSTSFHFLFFLQTHILAYLGRKAGREFLNVLPIVYLIVKPEAQVEEKAFLASFLAMSWAISNRSVSRIQ